MGGSPYVGFERAQQHLGERDHVSHHPGEDDQEGTAARTGTTGSADTSGEAAGTGGGWTAAGMISSPFIAG